MKFHLWIGGLYIETEGHNIILGKRKKLANCSSSVGLLTRNKQMKQNDFVHMTTYKLLKGLFSPHVIKPTAWVYNAKVSSKYLTFGKKNQLPAYKQRFRLKMCDNKRYKRTLKVTSIRARKVKMISFLAFIQVRIKITIRE